MKLQVFALLAVVAGACAMPQASDVVVVDSSNQPMPRIIVENTIRRIIQEISDGLRNAGLDPLIIRNEYIVLTPAPFVVELAVLIENLSFSGVSNIIIHSLDYNLLLSRLRFDISLPEINLEVENSSIEGYIFDDKIEGQFKGSLSIESIRLAGEVRVNIGITGISLRSIALNFSLGGITSDLTLLLQESDYSEALNNVLNVTIPNYVEDYSDDINKSLEDLVKAIFDLIS